MTSKHWTKPDSLGFDDLLTSTAVAVAATLTTAFGIDLRVPYFCRSSFEGHHLDVYRFEALPIR